MTLTPALNPITGSGNPGPMVERQHLVSQINNATTVVYNQLGKLKMLDKKFSSMEAYYLEQIVATIKAGNNARAKILATELSNVRRIRRTTQHTGMALEAIVIRFSTINEFAMILETIDPTVEMIKNIQVEISKAIPQANLAFSEVSSVTADVLASSNVRTDVGKIYTPIDAEAMNILNEIEGRLESEAKAKLPEIPTNMPGAATEEEKRQEVLIEG